MEPAMAQNVDPPPLGPEEAIRKILDEQRPHLLRRARFLVYKSGLARGQQLEDLAQELMQDLAVAALASAHRLSLGRDPIPWLLVILSNLLRRRQSEHHTEQRRFVRAKSEEEDGAAFFDRVAQQLGLGLQGSRDIEEALGDEELAAQMLDRLQATFRDVVQHNLMGDLSAEETARLLGIRAGLVRQRLHRALDQLRAYYGKGCAQ